MVEPLVWLFLKFTVMYSTETNLILTNVRRWHSWCPFLLPDVRLALCREGGTFCISLKLVQWQVWSSALKWWDGKVHPDFRSNQSLYLYKHTLCLELDLVWKILMISKVFKIKSKGKQPASLQIVFKEHYFYKKFSFWFNKCQDLRFLRLWKLTSPS